MLVIYIDILFMLKTPIILSHREETIWTFQGQSCIVSRLVGCILIRYSLM